MKDPAKGHSEVSMGRTLPEKWLIVEGNPVHSIFLQTLPDCFFFFAREFVLAGFLLNRLRKDTDLLAGVE